jgi:hypothetical protein
MNANQNIQISKDLVLRVEKLERAVFGTGNPKAITQRQAFKGATGGLRWLVSKGFFDRKQKFGEIEAELRKHGYYYSKQAVQTPLNNLSRKGGPLVGFKEKGKKVYAKRK